jgi:ABC-type transport system involved in multi-copper enzyme maturation permease subunit
MSGFLAIVLLTYRESIRKKILLVLIIFCIGLIVSSVLFPVVSPSARVKLVETWTFQSITFFGVLIAIFLAAVSIPSDIEDKRIFLILTKPISKETIMIGKLAGFILTTGIIILLMGLAGLSYIRLVAFFSPAAKEALEISQQIKADEFYFQQSPVEPSKQNSNGSLEGLYNKNLEVTLLGESTNFVAYKFNNLNKYLASDTKVKASIKLKVGEEKGRASSTLMIKILNPITNEVAAQNIEIAFKQPEIIQFDRKLVDKTGEVRIYLYRDNPVSYITADPESAVILSSPCNFEWSFFISLAIIFLQIILVLVFSVTCSTFLSGYVNIFLNMFLYFCGSGMQFLQSSLDLMKLSITEQIKQTNLTEIANQLHQHSDAPIPLWLMQISERVLGVVLRIIPDFSLFNAWDNLLKGYAVRFSEYSNLLEYLFIYSVIMLFIGVIAFRLRDIN